MKVHDDFTCQSNIIALGEVTAGSDKALKKDIHKLNDEEALAIIEHLFAVGWEWNECSSCAGQSSFGFIAQEVESILPEAVREEDTGLLTLNYNVFHAFEVKAIQILLERVKELENRIAQLS